MVTLIYSVIQSTEAPAEFTVPLKDVKVKENETAQFECEVSKSGCKVKWLRDGAELKGDKKYDMPSMGQKHMLIIRDAQLDDQTKYTIVVEEGVEATANLIVEGTKYTD